MSVARPILFLLLAVAIAAPAEAQSRRKDDSRRVTSRESSPSDREDRRRDRVRETDARMPISVQRPPRRDDDDREREDRDRRDRDDRWDRIAPITVLSPRAGYYYDYDRFGHVWGRVHGMTCLQLEDELEWAHEEWHWRNDRYRHQSWYDVEHARLELRIAEERAYSNCGRSWERRDCRDRGHYPRSGSALEVAILVLDILLGDVRGPARAAW